MTGQAVAFALAYLLASQRALWAVNTTTTAPRVFYSVQPRSNSFGPELSFAANLPATPLLMKFSRSATVFATDWQPQGDGGLFKQMLDWVVEQDARCPVASEWEGVVIANGYSDALTEETANAFYDNMVAAITRLRAQFGAGLRIIFSRPPIDAVPVAPFMATVRQACADLAANIPNVYMVDTDGITTSDGLHYDQPGMVEFGTRCAAGA